MFQLQSEEKSDMKRELSDVSNTKLDVKKDTELQEV
jgi:hypothetical protein